MPELHQAGLLAQPQNLQEQLTKRFQMSFAEIRDGAEIRWIERHNAHETFIEVDPHALASAAHGKTQQAVSHLLGTVLTEESSTGPCIVLLDEVETLAADRRKMSMEANPVDVHRATDAVLTQLDQLASEYPQLLFIATSNFAGAIDEAFSSRADLILTIDLPTPEACKAILLDTLDRLIQVYP